jgi:hypothetical protein
LIIPFLKILFIWLPQSIPTNLIFFPLLWLLLLKFLSGGDIGFFHTIGILGLFNIEIYIKDYFLSWVLVVHAYILATWEAEIGKIVV